MLIIVLQVSVEAGHGFFKQSDLCSVSVQLFARVSKAAQNNNDTSNAYDSVQFFVFGMSCM